MFKLTLASWEVVESLSTGGANTSNHMWTTPTLPTIWITDKTERAVDVTVTLHSTIVELCCQGECVGRAEVRCCIPL